VEFYRPKKKSPMVPIVSLIDILVTLLFFLIVTMRNFEKKEAKIPRPEIKVSLPTANSLKVETVTAQRTVLSLSPSGEAEIDGLRVPDGFLKEYLVGNRDNRPGLKLALRADEGCPWGKNLAAHSAALQAGYGDDEIIYRVKKPQPVEETSNDP